eukprot:UN22944
MMKNLELQYEVDHSSTINMSLRNRIDLLEKGLEKVKSRHERDKSIKCPKDEGKMRKLIFDLNKIITKQKNDITNLKTNQVSNAKYVNLLKEHKSLKLKFKTVKNEKVKKRGVNCMELESKINEQKDEITRLQNINKQTRKNLSREINNCSKKNDAKIKMAKEKEEVEKLLDKVQNEYQEK